MVGSGRGSERPGAGAPDRGNRAAARREAAE